MAVENWPVGWFFCKLLKPGPSLEGGLEELRELRPIRYRRLANSVDREVSWLRSSSFSCLRA